ncbi:MAG TPA: filamentous hemagglutinin N-terminal domain-containing protein [Methylococcaceae bacterium]|nr:filamentous hemagglutinin N-terminal domain-containing protein [Methylococcaceae bacterium]
MVTPVFADVTPSGLGTLINTPPVAGTTYNITGGTQAGSNLFHSFGKFSLTDPQSATFQNPVNVSNVIGRVTGGDPSNIDGTIRSTGAANLYLINPAGMIFGPNAKLEVGGSFHASTADYVKLDGKTFDAATTTAEAVLMTAVPSAFGFLDAPADIVVKTESDAFPDLRVPSGQSFSLVGGDITLGDDATKKGPEIEAKNGNIRLVAVSGKGEVPTDAGTPLAPGLAGGRIEMFDTSLSAPTIVPDEEPEATRKPGAIQLQAGAILMKRSSASVSTKTNVAGGTIDMTADRIELDQDSKITVNAYDEGDAGTLRIRTGDLLVRNGSHIDSVVGPGASGDGGLLDIVAERSVTISDNAQIQSSTRGSGRGGHIDLQTGVLQSWGFSVVSSTPVSSGIFANAESGSTGDGGNIDIDADSIRLSGGAQIAATTWGAGNAGHIDIRADDILLTGYAQWNGGIVPTGIHAAVAKGSTGQASNLDIAARRIFLRDGAQIDAASETSAKGGNINLTLLGEKGLLDLDNGSLITAINAGSGESGSINIRGADTVRLTHGSGITLETLQGDAGNIDIQAGFLVYLLDSFITTSAASGLGNGGDIAIDPVFVVLNNSQITANALQGAGGNIFITTQFLIQSMNSIINASSQFGLQGTVTVNSMDQNIAQSIAALPSSLLDASNLLQDDCASHTSGSTFTTAARGRAPLSPDDDLDTVFLSPSSSDCGI